MKPNTELVMLTHGEIRFLLWALPRVDTSVDEGMEYFERSGAVSSLRSRLHSNLPEVQAKEDKL